MSRFGYDYDEFDIPVPVEDSLLESNKTMHNLRTIIGLIIVFVIGGLQALKGLTWTNGIETALPLLLATEHFYFGNTRS